MFYLLNMRISKELIILSQLRNTLVVWRSNLSSYWLFFNIDLLFVQLVSEVNQGRFKYLHRFIFKGIIRWLRKVLTNPILLLSNCLEYLSHFYWFIYHLSIRILWKNLPLNLNPKLHVDFYDSLNKYFQSGVDTV